MSSTLVQLKYLVLKNLASLTEQEGDTQGALRFLALASDPQCFELHTSTDSLFWFRMGSLALKCANLPLVSIHLHVYVFDWMVEGPLCFGTRYPNQPFPLVNYRCAIG